MMEEIKVQPKEQALIDLLERFTCWLTRGEFFVEGFTATHFQCPLCNYKVDGSLLLLTETEVRNVWAEALEACCRFLGETPADYKSDPWEDIECPYKARHGVLAL